jgi:hypothetical protein
MIMRVAVALTIIALAACASSRYMLTGTARPPISPLAVTSRLLKKADFW